MYLKNVPYCTVIYFHTLVIIIFQLVVLDKDGKHLDRLSPWAHYVTQPEKAIIYDQRFWSPPDDQVDYRFLRVLELVIDFI